MQKSRQILIQENQVRRSESTLPQGKTLFVANIPLFITETDLKTAFSTIGPVDEVIVFKRSTQISTKHSQNEKDDFFFAKKSIDEFKNAYVVFQTTKSIQDALRTKRLDFSNASGESSLVTGTAKWLAEYNSTFVDEKQLSECVSSYMNDFEQREQEEREKARKPEVDEDGWVTVKRGKAGGGFEQKESIIKALEEKITQGKSRKEFKNFYTFQFRESRQKHIVSLRKRFEQDKKKVEALKKARRFKPY